MSAAGALTGGARHTRGRNYILGYCLFEARPPFRVARMGNEPLLDSRSLIEELQCDDPGQTARGVHGYENGSNLVFLSSVVREGDAVLFGVGLNDVRFVFPEYAVADLVANTHPIQSHPIPASAAEYLCDVAVDLVTRRIQDRTLAWRNGYLECGEKSCCVRWTNAMDDLTLLSDDQPLSITRLLSFEISRRCNLAAEHPACPIHDRTRHDSSLVLVPLSDDLIVDTAVAAYSRFGFQGHVTF